MQTFKLNQTKFPCGVVETNKAVFNPSNEANLEKVFIRKKGFSCNFRDKSLALYRLPILEKFAIQNKAKFYTLGSEFSGEIVAVGDKVRGFKIGDAIMSNGSYPSEHPSGNAGLPTNHGSKEYDAIHYSKVIKIPENMSWAVASCFQIGAQTSYSMIRRLGVKAGDKVLISGATSNTSLFAINALKKMDVEICVLTSRATFKQQLLALGVKEVFVVDLKESLLQNESMRQYLKKKGGFDVAIDPFFDLYMNRMLEVLKIGGRYSTCGLFDQHPLLKANQKNTGERTDAIVQAFTKNITIVGNCLGTTEDLRNALKDYKNGVLNVVLDQVYTRNQVQAFFHRTFNAKERFGKVVYLYDK
ncbi:MAG: zinc-binding alcohol dehydrogenase family protein [Bacteroidota bacterium]